MPDEYLLIIQRAREHLIDFEIATNQKYEPNYHHETISKELEHIEKFGDRDYKILLITVPPRHGKSQQCSIDFPAWYLGRNPDKEIITASYSADLAQEFGGKTREKIDGEACRLIFPEVRLREDERARGRWRTQQGGSYTSVGVGGPITGRGANILLIDDPVKNREDANSEVQREKVWDWFTSTAFTRLEPKGVAIIIMTRWHMDDLTGRILAHPELSKRVKMLRFTAIAEYDEEERKRGVALWPQKYNVNALQEIRDAIGPYDWTALYMGSPILSENQEFKPIWRRTITEFELSIQNTRNYLTIDTAMSKRAYADYTAFCDNRVNKENYWHLKVWRSKIGPEELVDTLFVLHEKHRYIKIGIEKTAYLDGLKPFLDSEQRKRDKFLPIVELHHNQTAKEIRIRGLIPRYASGSIFHVEGQCAPLEEEQLQFPVGVHDDALDATAYQLQIAEDGVRTVSSYTPKLRELSN